MSEPGKRRKILNYLKKSHYNVVPMQETHSTVSVIREWAAQLGTHENFKSFWNSFNNVSCGVAILIKEDPYFQATEIYDDQIGRIMTITVETNNTTVQIASIYAPNLPSNHENFFKTLRNVLNIEGKHIIGSDFNMVEDPIRDR